MEDKKLPLEHVSEEEGKIVYKDGRISAVLIEFGKADDQGNVFMPGML